MIPLIRPKLPPWELIRKHYSASQEAGQLSNFGPAYHGLSRKIQHRTGRSCVPVSSGTHAIQVAAQMSFPRGGQVILPDFTHIGTLNAVLAAGCKPLLWPVSVNTWTLKRAGLESALRQSAGMVVVSPFGYRVDTEAYDEIGRRAGRPVVYDFAGAWGYFPKTTNPVCYSLHATKSLACGEGGFVLLEAAQFIEAKRLTNFNILPDHEIASPWGNNMKPDELTCAIALAHLDREADIARNVRARHELIGFYQKSLPCVPHALHVHAAPSLCVLRIPGADRIVAGARGFGVKRYYPLLSRMTGLATISCGRSSSDAMTECVALPSSATVDEAADVVKEIRDILKG